MKELQKGSAATGDLPHGCRLCGEGAKLVLLVTGQCSCSCFYCPISEAKRGRAVTYANEKSVESDGDIIFEADSIDAGGTGVTGGDPLLPFEETLRLIRLLKEKYGPEHHIHLYTATPDADKVRQLADAGLDEIRFHPPPEDWLRFSETGFPTAVRAAGEAGMDVGLEVPVIPGMKGELLALIRAAEHAGAQFVNLNELEFSDTNWRELKARGFTIKNDVESSAAGSEELALEVLRDSEAGIPLHYCSAAFKDGVQLRRRIMRRAESTATPLEVITDDGTFVFGIVETPDPEGLAAAISREFEVPPELVRVNPEMGRVEVAAWVLEDIFTEVDAPCFIIEEYPTADRLEVERRPLDES